jgi:hypothetical protein
MLHLLWKRECVVMKTLRHLYKVNILYFQHTSGIHTDIYTVLFCRKVAYTRYNVASILE